ncbi:tyrosine-type recombinase/integrase [Thermaerobacillus caldiproteolyticus]|uniref:tyrosine-type recombinase/integrase n=1 Tax=Thermaerobacillus caldiproteolyticus TaxID=247480 RepID=UPI00188C03A1|nr:tyrosine-type recombinase/integrase [Anoxybacillus caldiproteolyticus]QPA31462.1 tyrosine-type recombinase/integrase [Anoxybacillus caldiproteolyticus]
MRTVQPIRDVEKIAAMKAELLKTGRRNWFLFVLGINTGLRISDILKLKVKDVKGKSRLMIYEQKTGKYKQFKINRELQQHRAANKIGISEIGTHTLRKTFGYHFYQRTKDVALLQEILNHSSPSITLRYIGINQDIIDNAVDDFSL